MSFRLEIHAPFGPPSAQPTCIPIVASEQLSTCLRSDNIWLVPQAGGEEIAAISLGWEYGHTDMVLAHWLKTEPDTTYLNQVCATLQTELDELATKHDQLEADGKFLSEDDEYRMWELEDAIETIRRGCFWEEQPNALGDNCVALYRSVSAPNVPWNIKSAVDVIKANGAFTVHFFRCQMPDGQAGKRFTIKWDRYELEFPNDGPDATIRALNPNLTDAQIASYRATIKSLRDKKSLTPEEETEIQSKRDEQQVKKADLRKRGKYLKSHPTEKAAIEKAIEDLRKEIETIKKGKGLTPAEELQLKDAVKGLYAFETSANLGLSSQHSTDELISITVVPDPRGYVVLHANPGNHTSVHEVKWLTKTGKFGTVWNASKLELDADGGAFMFRFDIPRVSRWGRLSSREYQFGMPIGAITFSHDTYLPNAQTKVTPTHTLNGSAPNQKLTWQIELESTLQTDFPFIYTMTLEASGAPRVEDPRTLFMLEGSKTIDFVPSSHDGKRVAAVTIMDVEGVLELGKFENYQVRVFDRGRQVMQGVIKDIRYETISVKTKKWEFQILDRWSVLDEDLIWTEPPGDNKEFAYYEKQLACNRGFRNAEVITQRTEIILPKAPSGEKYRLNPKMGTARGRWMREIYDNHGLRVIMRFDAYGNLRIGPKSMQGDTKYRYDRDPKKAGNRFQSCRNVKLKLDFSDFYNLFTVLGAKDLVTKVRYASRWANSSSVFNPKAIDYCGTWKPYPPVEDETLLTQEAVDRVCRILFEKYGHPKFIWEFDTYYDDELREGDWIYFEGKLVEVIGISSASRRKDRMGLSVKEIL